MYASRLCSGLTVVMRRHGKDDWCRYIGSFFPGPRRLRLHEERGAKIFSYLEGLKIEF